MQKRGSRLINREPLFCITPSFPKHSFKNSALFPYFRYDDNPLFMLSSLRSCFLQKETALIKKIKAMIQTPNHTNVNIFQP